MATNTHLCELQPPKITRWTGNLEDFLGHHPGFQSFQFTDSQIGCMVPDQEALETVSKEVKVDGNWMAHGVVSVKQHMLSSYVRE